MFVSPNQRTERDAWYAIVLVLPTDGKVTTIKSLARTSPQGLNKIGSIRMLGRLWKVASSLRDDDGLHAQ